MTNINWQPGLTLDEVEKACILQALRWFRGNKTQTAIALGISVKTIDNKLEKYEQDGKAAEDKDARDAEQNRRTLNRMRGLPEDAPETEKRQESLFGAIAGVHMEPALEARPQQSVPMPERQEVQKVLPGHVAAGRERGRR